MKKKMICITIILFVILQLGFVSDASAARNRIIKKNNHSYYYNSKGKLVKNKVFTYRGKKYYAQKKGAIAKSKFITWNGKKYYASKNGTLVQGKFFNVSGKRYYAQKKGSIAQKTFFRVKGKLYFAGKSGVVQKDTTIKVNQKLYYAQKDYSIATNKKVTVGEKEYNADSKGILTLIQAEDFTNDEQTTEKDNTQSTSEEPKKECEHEWVVDVAAHYEWQNVYDENGDEVEHQFCKTCGCDINQLMDDLNAIDPGWGWGQALTYHLNQSPLCNGGANSKYISIIDENGNVVDHPLKERGYSKYTYMPDTYKCSKCGAKLFYSNSDRRTYINYNLFQKYGENIDISLIKWSASNAGKLDDGGTVIINGKILTCVEW